MDGETGKRKLCGEYKERGRSGREYGGETAKIKPNIVDF